MTVYIGKQFYMGSLQWHLVHYLINQNYQYKDITESLVSSVSGHCPADGGSSYVRVGEGRSLGTGGGDHSAGGRHGNHSGLRGNVYPSAQHKPDMLCLYTNIYYWWLFVFRYKENKLFYKG